LTLSVTIEKREGKKVEAETGPGMLYYSKPNGHVNERGDLLCSSNMSSVRGCSANALTRFSIARGRGNAIRFVETHLSEVLRA